MIPELHYCRSLLEQSHAEPSSSQRGFSANMQFKFDPFQGGKNPLDFKKSLIGLEDVLMIQGRKISELSESCIPVDLTETRALIETEIRKPQTSEDDRARLEELIEKLDDEIETTTEHNLDQVTQEFESNLTASLDPHSKMPPEKLLKLKDTITALFSTKAFTAVAAAIDVKSQKRFGGTFIAPGTNIPERSCDLIIPKDPKAPIQIIAKIKNVYETFVSKTGMRELPKPVTIDATATYTIQRNGKVAAVATVDLTRGPSSPAI